MEERANRLCSQCIDRGPDEFIAHRFDVAANVVSTVAEHQGYGLMNLVKTVDEFLATAEQYGLVRTVVVLRQFPELTLALNPRRADAYVPPTMRSRSDLPSPSKASQAQLASLPI